MSDPDKSIELFRQDGEEFRSVRATLRDGEFMIDTQDMGKVWRKLGATATTNSGPSCRKRRGGNC